MSKFAIRYLFKKKILIAVFFALFFVAGFSARSNSVSALPKCFDNAARRAAAEGVSNVYPRLGMSYNSTGCGIVGNDTQWVLISSYYGTATGAPGSTLQTPNAYFKVISKGQPTTGVSVAVTRSTSSDQRCNYTTNDDVAISVNGVQIGTLDTNTSVSHTIPASEFVLDTNVGSDAWVWQQKMIVKANVSTAVHCRIKMNSYTAGTYVTITEDQDPVSSYTENNQQYNQTNAGQGGGLKANLGPASSGINGALALYEELTQSYTVEYSMSFRMRCDQKIAQPVRLRYYDPDSYKASNKPGTTQPAGSMGLAVYNESTGNLVADWTIDEGNDEYGERAFIMQPDTSYSMVYYNVTAVNGIQFWMPYSEATTSQPTFSCANTTAGTCNVSGIYNASRGGTDIWPGDRITFDVTLNNIPAGRQLGVNGSDYPGQGDYGNYLVDTSQYARGSPAGVYTVTAAPPTGTLPTNGVVNFDDIMFANNGLEGDGNIRNIIAPSTPNTYSFNWGLVNPNVNWLPSIKCAGTITVKDPSPQLSCSMDGAPNGAGSSVSVDKGSSFYPNAIVKHNGPSVAPNVNPLYVVFFIRPFGSGVPWNLSSLIGYRSGFINNGNTYRFWPGTSYSANTVGTYETLAVLADDLAGTLERGRCTGTLTVKEIPITIQGRIYNAYDKNKQYTGLKVYSCNLDGDGNQIVGTTDADGVFTMQVPYGAGFCVGLVALPAGAAGAYVRPWSTGYTTYCAGFGWTPRVPKDYCTAPNATQNPGLSANLGRYDYQGAGYFANNGYDRNSDSGYDIAITFPPKISCTLDPIGAINAGAPNNYTPVMTFTDDGGTTEPPVKSTGFAGSATLKIKSGSGVEYGSTASVAVTKPRGTANPITFGSYTINERDTFNQTATVNVTGDDMPTGDVTCSTLQLKSVYEPYIKVYGSDVRAGAAFKAGNVCPTVTSGSVYGFASGSGANYKGSSSQFSITSLMNVNQFFSASNRATNATPPSGLTFANVTGTGDTTFGGAYGGSGVCMTDFFTETQDDTIQKGSFTGGFASGKAQYSLTANSTLGTTTVPLGSQAAIYVDGNLYINGDITFAVGAANDVQMPNLVIIARGNIYVAAGVKRLDGMYIAQPRAGSETTQGRFYTCAKGLSQLYTAAELSSSCVNQLSVNGAVVAQQIKFLRTIGSYIVDSTVGEIPNFADGSGSGNGANTKAAEVINFTPEMFIAPSPLKDPNTVGTTTSATYDAIYGLPPIY